MLVVPVQAEPLLPDAEKTLICIEGDGDQNTHRLVLTGKEGEQFDNPWMTQEEFYTDTNIFVIHRFFGADGQPLMDGNEAVKSTFSIDRYTGRFVFKGMIARTQGLCKEEVERLF
jgi:hypothetical protein